MNDKILESLNEKYGLELTDIGKTNERAQKMTEINKLRFQNITYIAAKSKFESWRRQHSLRAKIKEKAEAYDGEVSERKRTKISEDIAILMSKYIFLKTNKGESPETIARRAIRLNDEMLDNSRGKRTAILKELDKEVEKARITDRNIGTISKEDREEIEKEIEKAKLEDNAENIETDNTEDLKPEEVISEVEEDTKEDDISDLNSAEEVDAPIENPEKEEEESKSTGSGILIVPFEKVQEYNNSQESKEAKKEIIRIPLKKVKELEKKEDKGVIAKGMTDEEIEASRRLLEETAPKPKDNITSFKVKMPRERNEGESAKEYEDYLDEFYKNLREEYYRLRTPKTIKDEEPKEEQKEIEKPNNNNYRDEINRLKEMAANLREQVDATKEAKRQANKSVEEAKRAAEEKRKQEEDEVKKAQEERAQAEEKRKKKQEAMETVIEQFKAYLEGMKQEIQATQEDIKNAQAEELEIKDASEKESAENEKKKAEAYRGRDEANESISSQEAYIQEMLSSMDKKEKSDSKKSSK